MWLLSEEGLELLRSVPSPCWLLLSFLCVGAQLGAVTGVHDFSVYRMQQFDLHGAHLGSRSAVVNMEARGAGVTMLGRKCVVIRWSELTMDSFRQMIEHGAGSLLVLLPRDWLGEDPNVVQGWMELEQELLALEVAIPVYLAYENPELLEIHEKLSEASDGGQNGSAAATLISAVLGQGYQVAAESSESVPLANHEVVTLVGKLVGAGFEQDLPSIALVAHYDSFGLAPALSMGGDSNGSGVAALLELVRLFSRVYSDPLWHPKYNLLFVLTGGGKLNYFGTKYFIEDMLEDADSHLLVDADYTFCLDSLAGEDSDEDYNLFLHFSKPPKEGSKAFPLLQLLNSSVSMLPGISLTMHHKKIKIGEELLSWEHERFSLRRIPASTLSHFGSASDPRRTSMFHSRASVKTLSTSVRLLAEAIGHHILGLNQSSSSLFSGSLGVREDILAAWLQQISSTPRSPQLLTKEHPLIQFLEQTLTQYVHEVSTFSHHPDKSDPEFVLYTVSTADLHIYSVKPAVFDLFLALAIASYVGVIYMIVLHYQWWLVGIAPLLTKKTIKIE